jgi:transposase
LATEVFLGNPSRFVNGKALAITSGWSPANTPGRQRLGRLSKQGNPLLRFLSGEAAMHAVRRDPELQRFYRRKLQQKGLGKARIAAARKLGGSGSCCAIRSITTSSAAVAHDGSHDGDARAGMLAWVVVVSDRQTD